MTKGQPKHFNSVREWWVKVFQILPGDNDIPEGCA